MLGSVTTSPANQTTAIKQTSRKPTPKWIFGIVAIVLALGLAWLALDGDRSDPQGTGEGPAGATSIGPLLVSGHMMISVTELDRLTPPIVSLGDQGDIAGSRSDNTAALTLGSAGALTLAGLVLLLARRFRSNSVTKTSEQKYRLSKTGWLARQQPPDGASNLGSPTGRAAPLSQWRRSRTNPANKTPGLGVP